MPARSADEDSSQASTSLADFLTAQLQATLEGRLLCVLSPARASDDACSLTSHQRAAPEL